MDIGSELIEHWGSFEYPCGVKDLQSRFTYANSAYLRMQNLPQHYSIEGRMDGELPTPTYEFEKAFQEHDRLVLDSDTVHSSIEIHPFGKDKLLEGWIFHKRPFYFNRVVVGVFFWAEPARYLAISP